MDVIRRLFKKITEERLIRRSDEEVTDKCGETSYELACQGVPNNSGTCSISVALQCILAMQATRTAFMSLQDPVPSCQISDRQSMTNLIRFFFSQRRLQHSMAEEEQKKSSRNDFDPAASIATCLYETFPDYFYPLGEGNCCINALFTILHTVIEEGYVKGLEENLTGKYATRTTCKSCGATYDFLDNDIMLSFMVADEEKFDLFRYLKSHAGEVNIISEGRNISTAFITFSSLFYFAQRATNVPQVFKQYGCKSVGCDAVYDVRHRTTIRHLPRTLIFDISLLHCSKSRRLYEEVLDLSEHMESQSTTNCKYKLVAAIKEVLSGKHVIAYVRASKYLKPNVNISSALYGKVEKTWFEMDDENMDVVPLERLFKVKADEQFLLLIYEQLN